MAVYKCSMTLFSSDKHDDALGAFRWTREKLSSVSSKKLRFQELQSGLQEEEEMCKRVVIGVGIWNNIIEWYYFVKNTRIWAVYFSLQGMKGEQGTKVARHK